MLNNKRSINIKRIHLFFFLLLFPFQVFHQTLVTNHVMNIQCFEVFVLLWTKGHNLKTLSITWFVFVHPDGPDNALQCRVHHPGNRLP